MRAQALRARPKRPYRTTTDSRPGLPISPNLLARRFTVARPNTAWVTDMTYLWTPQGWSMSERIDRKLALDALHMALAQRRPARGLIHHLNRGSPYASKDYQQLLAKHGLRGSMSRRGDCCDNAVAESFFASLKLELVYQVQWRNPPEARIAIFEYLEFFYNRRRRHSSLGYLSPVEFERRNHPRLAA